MFNSLTNPLTIVPDSLEEVPPKSSLPWVWFGFFFVAAFVIEETLMIALGLDRDIGAGVLLIIALAGWIYWLVCVGKFHQILREITRNQYPIAGAEAAFKHIIPLYNLFWIFQWPVAMSDYLNRRGRVKMISGNIIGVALLLSLITSRFLDGGLGLAGTFVVGMYLSSRLRAHVELITSRDLLPPDPDPALFMHPPVGSQATPSTDSPMGLSSQGN